MNASCARLRNIGSHGAYKRVESHPSLVRCCNCHRNSISMSRISNWPRDVDARGFQSLPLPGSSLSSWPTPVRNKLDSVCEKSLGLVTRSNLGQASLRAFWPNCFGKRYHIGDRIRRERGTGSGMFCVIPLSANKRTAVHCHVDRGEGSGSHQPSVPRRGGEQSTQFETPSSIEIARVVYSQQVRFRVVAQRSQKKLPGLHHSEDTRHAAIRSVRPFQEQSGDVGEAGVCATREGHTHIHKRRRTHTTQSIQGPMGSLVIPRRGLREGRRNMPADVCPVAHDQAEKCSAAIERRKDGTGRSHDQESDRTSSVGTEVGSFTPIRAERGKSRAIPTRAWRGT